MSRYLERAGNTARLLEINLLYLLEAEDALPRGGAVEAAAQHQRQRGRLRRSATAAREITAARSSSS